jgi:hypothetical protein
MLHMCAGILVANPADVVQTKFIAYRAKSPAEYAERAARIAASCTAARSLAVEGTCVLAAQPAVASASASAAPVPQMCAAQGAKRYYGSAAIQSCVQAPYQCSQQAVRFSRPHQLFHHHWRQHRPSATSAATAASSATMLRPGGAPVGIPLKPPAPTCPCSVQVYVPAGPRTVTGVPLQNARMAYYILIREEGLVNGLYKGFFANFACNCMQGAAEIATYDVAKTTALNAGYRDSVPVHLASGVVRAARLVCLSCRVLTDGRSECACMNMHEHAFMARVPGASSSKSALQAGTKLKSFEKRCVCRHHSWPGGYCALEPFRRRFHETDGGKKGA